MTAETREAAPRLLKRSDMNCRAGSAPWSRWAGGVGGEPGRLLPRLRPLGHFLDLLPDGHVIERGELYYGGGRSFAALVDTGPAAAPGRPRVR